MKVSESPPQCAGCADSEWDQRVQHNLTFCLDLWLMHLTGWIFASSVNMWLNSKKPQGVLQCSRWEHEVYVAWFQTSESPLFFFQALQIGLVFCSLTADPRLWALWFRRFAKSSIASARTCSFWSVFMQILWVGLHKSGSDGNIMKFIAHHNIVKNCGIYRLSYNLDLLASQE